MIKDSLYNIKRHTVIPDCAVKFIEEMSKGNYTFGRHELTDDVYVNIEEYFPKNIADAKFESHKDYIDVQLLISGREDLYYTDINNLSALDSYNKEKDIMFYSDSVANYPKITLDGSNFILLYPQDAHAPQVGNAEYNGKIVKAVIKIKV